MALHNSFISRRSLLTSGAATLGLVGAGTMLAGCGGAASGSASAASASASAAASSEAASAASASTAAAAPAIAINDTMEELKLVLLGKDAKIACIIVANQRGYYTDEKLDIGTPEVVSGGFPEAMPMLSDGTVDVLPFGSIPTCTYVGQGDDLVIFGGTVTNGSEALVPVADKDKYKTAEDFKGKKIACFRMETGHMVTKSWLRQQGLKIGDKPEDVDNGTADVAFILLESMAAEAAAVENGEVDMCFVNSGQGYQFIQSGKLAVAFQPQELIGHDFPCCRQSTNRAAFEQKKSQLVKFEIANIRAMYDIANDQEGVVQDIMDYSGQPEDFCEAITYGLGDYVAAMQFEMDPRTNDVYAFYGDMVDNGDIQDPNKDLILEHMDSTIYQTALQTLIDRGENADFYQGLMTKFQTNNTMGV